MWAVMRSRPQDGMEIGLASVHGYVSMGGSTGRMRDGVWTVDHRSPVFIPYSDHRFTEAGWDVLRVYSTREEADRVNDRLWRRYRSRAVAR